MPSGSQHYRDGRLHPENHQELLKCRRHVAHSGLPSELASFSTSSLCCSWDPAACCALSSSLPVKLELLTPSTHTRSAVHLQSRFRTILLPICSSSAGVQQSPCSPSAVPHRQLHRQFAHSCCDDHLITLPLPRAHAHCNIAKCYQLGAMVTLTPPPSHVFTRIGCRVF